MKKFLILAAVLLCACTSLDTRLTQEESDIHIYYEEPNTDFDDLGEIIAVSRYNHAEEGVKKLMRSAVELGANAVVIRRRGNRDGAYRIEATAIRYIQSTGTP